MTLDLVIFNTRKQSFVMDCYNKRKHMITHLASLAKSSQIPLNPIHTGVWGFLRSPSMTGNQVKMLFKSDY